jgi:hypothetical protein
VKNFIIALCLDGPEKGKWFANDHHSLKVIKLEQRDKLLFADVNIITYRIEKLYHSSWKVTLKFWVSGVPDNSMLPEWAFPDKEVCDIRMVNS